MKFSILIPARNEEKYIGRAIESAKAAARPYPGDVEIVVALNRCTDRTEEIARGFGAKIVREDSRCMARIRNAAAREATGQIVITLDADSVMTENMLSEIDGELSKGDCIGGGVLIKPERVSIGILMSALMIFPVIWWHRISAGLFWCRRSDFQAIGGFNEDMVSAEDIDFARRLRAYGKKQGKRFATIRRAHIVTSCRKFDKFGDWYLFLNPHLVRRAFKGKDQTVADMFYYDFEH